MNGAGFGEGMFLLLKNWYGLYAQLYMQRHAYVSLQHQTLMMQCNKTYKEETFRYMCVCVCCSSTNLSKINKIAVNKGGTDNCSLHVSARINSKT